MRLESSIGVVPAAVRRGELNREQIISIGHGRLFVMSAGLGLPRLWRRSTTRAIAGFTRSFEQTGGHEIEKRLDVAIVAARTELVQSCEKLVERIPSDVSLLAVAIDNQSIHVISAGACRAYVQRTGPPRRLTPRQDDVGGLLVETPVRSSMPLEPLDIVLAGSVSAFSSHSVTRVATILTEDREAPVSTLVSVLVEPAAKSGVGGAALVFRVK